MKEGDIYMNGMYHNPNDNWFPRPQTPEEADAMVSAGCLAFVVMMFIAFTIMALLSP